VVRLTLVFPDGVLLVPGAPYIRYDGLLPIDGLGFTDQTGDTAPSIAGALTIQPWGPVGISLDGIYQDRSSKLSAEEASF
jgi:hypothetical protein